MPNEKRLDRMKKKAEARAERRKGPLDEMKKKAEARAEKRKAEPEPRTGKDVGAPQ